MKQELRDKLRKIYVLFSNPFNFKRKQNVLLSKNRTKSIFIDVSNLNLENFLPANRKKTSKSTNLIEVAANLKPSRK
jgi:hypothetical protein